ncbi:MAG: adenine-specific methyltransferase EcoRI family protein [Oscillospiraceae bacterium]|jgi:hypothetical protein|nr:adenine-specific methyltransferase EcoRI family protein [Oscillospiraceae bacterium]
MSKPRLLNAYNRKNDEFFTLFEDIAAEITNYKDQLRGKRILCPCDWDESLTGELVYSEGDYVYPGNLLEQGGTVKKVDLGKSKRVIKDINVVKCNFVKFLVAHAESYGIKSVYVSGYNPTTGEGVKFQNVDYSKYDVVITNPPFSAFREFIDIMISNRMQFIVIGPQNAITYKETFHYIKENQLWLGYHYHLSGFRLPNGTIIPKNDSLPRCCCWFTNMDVKYRHDKMILTEEYSPEKFPHYYNYDGIDVNRTLKIPFDYDGVMGVPITFLQKYNPEQFEIITKGIDAKKTRRFQGDKAALWIEKDGRPFREPFERILIRNKEVYRDEN